MSNNGGNVLPDQTHFGPMWPSLFRSAAFVGHSGPTWPDSAHLVGQLGPLWLHPTLCWANVAQFFPFRRFCGPLWPTSARFGAFSGPRWPTFVRSLVSLGHCGPLALRVVPSCIGAGPELGIFVLAARSPVTSSAAGRLCCQWASMPMWLVTSTAARLGLAATRRPPADHYWVGVNKHRAT